MLFLADTANVVANDDSQRSPTALALSETETKDTLIRLHGEEDLKQITNYFNGEFDYTRFNINNNNNISNSRKHSFDCMASLTQQRQTSISADDTMSSSSVGTTRDKSKSNFLATFKASSERNLSGCDKINVIYFSQQLNTLPECVFENKTRDSNFQTGAIAKPPVPLPRKLLKIEDKMEIKLSSDESLHSNTEIVETKNDAMICTKNSGSESEPSTFLSSFDKNSIITNDSDSDSYEPISEVGLRINTSYSSRPFKDMCSEHSSDNLRDNKPKNESVKNIPENTTAEPIGDLHPEVSIEKLADSKSENTKQNKVFLRVGEHSDIKSKSSIFDIDEKMSPASIKRVLKNAFLTSERKFEKNATNSEMTKNISKSDDRKFDNVQFRCCQMFVEAARKALLLFWFCLVFSDLFLK